MVIQVGDGTKQATVTATHKVKKDVQNELTKKAVGGAATEEDWASKKGAAAPVASGVATPSTGTAAAANSVRPVASPQ